MKKLLACLLAASLLLCLAACGGPSDAETSPSPSFPSSPSLEEDPTAAYAQEYTQAVAGMDADTVMFTVNGEPVTAEYFLYWLSYDCFDWSYYAGGQIDFTAEVSEGVTAADFLKQDAQRMAALYVTMEQKAVASGCWLTAEQEAQWEQIKENYREQMGEDQFALSLRQLGLSETGFDRVGKVREISAVYDNLLAAMTSEPTRADMDQYTTQNDTYKAKHILILTAVEGEDGAVALSTGGAPTNEDGTAFTGTAQEYNEAALARAQDILARLNAAAEPIALFDQLMHQYSQDTGLAANPDGYLFSSGQMVEPFENATKALEYGAYTAEPVESRFGYHIILRLDVAQECRQDQMTEIISGWADEMVVADPSPEYEGLDTAQFYENYTDYVDALYTQWQEQHPDPVS